MGRRESNYWFLNVREYCSWKKTRSRRLKSLNKYIVSLAQGKWTPASQQYIQVENYKTFSANKRSEALEYFYQRSQKTTWFWGRVQLACKLNSAEWLPGIAASWLIHRPLQFSAWDLMLTPTTPGLHILFWLCGTHYEKFSFFIKIGEQRDTGRYGNRYMFLYLFTGACVWTD